MTDQNKWILVTGATGFLGQRLCERLSAEGERVIAVKKGRFSSLPDVGIRKLPDLETLKKLTGSAWYSSAKAQKELAYKPRHSVFEWLNGDAS